jgi:hypothetical protein
MRNLFILNGAIPVIVAHSLIEREYSADENIVVLENMHSGDARGKLSGPNNQRVVELLADILPVDQISTCAFPTTLTEFLANPLVAIREARVFVKKAQEIGNQFPGHFDRIFYSDNSRVQWGLYPKGRRWISIEHGAGEYLLSLPGHRLRAYRFLQRWIVRLCTGAYEFFPDEIILTDGGACRSYPQHEFQGTPVRRVAPPNVGDIFAKFRTVLQNQEPALLSELDSLKAIASKYDQVFLYLPQFLIPKRDRKTLIEQQLQVVKPANALFVLKPHPRDSNNYLELFQQLGLKAIEITHPLGRNIPAEFFLALIPNAQPIACFSATLFYAIWWMKRPAWYLCGKTIDMPALVKMYTEYFARDIERQNGSQAI